MSKTDKTPADLRPEPGIQPDNNPDRPRHLHLYRILPDGKRMRYRFTIDRNSNILKEEAVGEAPPPAPAKPLSPEAAAARKKAMERHVQNLRERGFVVDENPDGKVVVRSIPREEQIAQRLMAGAPVDFEGHEKWKTDYDALIADTKARMEAGTCTNCELGRIKDKFRARLVEHLKTLPKPTNAPVPPDSRPGEPS